MRRFNILASVILLCFMTACNKIKITLPQDNLPDDKELVRKATEGDEDAAFEIGKMYVNGEGVEQSTEEAVKWYRLAAKQGIEPAISCLKELGVEY